MTDDDLFFRQRTKREYRIRVPAPGEFTNAWQVLGMHNHDRRRVLVWEGAQDQPRPRIGSGRVDANPPLARKRRVRGRR